MTQDTSPTDAQPRKLHAEVLSQRHSMFSGNLLCDEDIRFAAECERMRVDRNGSVLSILLVRLHAQDTESLTFFARVLEGRLRITDTPGLLSDGRVVILLPDTATEGAWKVAADISEVYPLGLERPECEVISYPTHVRHRDVDLSEEQDSNDNSDSKTPNSRTDKSDRSVTSTRGKLKSDPSNELFFVQSLPFWKRAIDVFGGTVGLLASLPVLTVAVVAVKMTSRGPAFFRQERAGLGGKPFVIWKLRTMHADAEEKKQELQKYSQQDGPAFKMENDPRITTVGRFLRGTSMDELPQFWNVLKGEMSLVGPRPLPVEEAAACVGWQRRRLHVLPGLTCTWQVSERGNVSFDEWVRMDLRYANQPNLWEDLYLLGITLPSLLLRRGIR